ncbi:hypothetical protein PS838_05731 [Pseudomonas fluorescens]|nr:hypothetical protein PS838_05731 [Pseudomonas fluorescens]
MHQVDVLFVLQFSVEKLVDHVELFRLADLFLRGQQPLRGINALLTLTQRSVQCLRPTADQGNDNGTLRPLATR